MTNQPPGQHDDWEQLAAAHALHTLDGDDEQRFLAHLSDCQRCAASLDDYNLIAAQLGSLADTEQDELPAWDRMRTRVVDAPSSTLVTLGHQRTRPRNAARLLGAAAAVVALTGVAVAGWDVTHGAGGHRPLVAAAVSACEQQPACRVIRLHNPDGASPAAVLVKHDRVTLVPLAMRTAPAGKTYVLWQLRRDGGPILVTEFRAAGRQITSSLLPADYSDTAAFAVSVESARMAPARPTHVLAVGSAA